jgi:precorrin-6Y C5,15-methyltransferase (decarboxylating)
MSKTQWLTIIGLGEDGPDGLSAASVKALNNAEIVMGAARHLSLLPDLAAKTIEWPVPFTDGIPMLLGHHGRKVVMLASGDPFWFGAGTSVTKHLDRSEWVAHPGQSTFSLAASRLGWALQDTLCVGLHAAPLSRLRSHLTRDAQCIVLLRDGSAVGELAAYLSDQGFGTSEMHVMEALGGPNEQLRSVIADQYDLTDVAHPVAVGLRVLGAGKTLPRASGLPDDLFDHDGQITKRPVRALTLSALAPCPGELLWDIGGGSGSISIEWLLSHPTTQAIAVEAHPERAARIAANAAQLGVDRLQVVQAKAPDGLGDLPKPDAVFVGGGVSEEMLITLWSLLPTGTRLVANAVTLEAEALFARWQADKGGDLMRIELAESKPLGSKRGWKSAYPVVQWSVTV